jgi:adenosylcobinamide-GDP ribazoletransferase
MHEFKLIRLALSFLTLLGVSPKEQATSYEIGRSQKYFAIGGLVFGLLNLSLIFLLLPLEKPWIMALCIVLANLFLSGGLHMDALMDSFDGIASNKKTREEIVKVLTDSNTGAFGAMAGVVVIMTKITCLANINFTGNLFLIAFILFLTPIITRSMFVVIMAIQIKKNDPMNTTGKVGSIFKDSQKPVLDIVSNVIILKLSALAFLLCHWLPLSKLIICDFILVPWLLSLFLIYYWLRFKLQGHNGDSLGAGSEIGEALMFFVLSLVF